MNSGEEINNGFMVLLDVVLAIILELLNENEEPVPWHNTIFTDQQYFYHV